MEILVRQTRDDTNSWVGKLLIVKDEGSKAVFSMTDGRSLKENNAKNNNKKFGGSDSRQSKSNAFVSQIIYNMNDWTFSRRSRR
jgi:hypothetical protein